MDTPFLIPTVALDDLLQFHLKHFGTVFAGASLWTDTDHVQQGEDLIQDEENDLGYYSDGCPRTLTDEQIQIFRHSEIQRVLLQQRRDMEADAELESEQETEEKIETQAVSINDHDSSRKRANAALLKVSERDRLQFAADTEKARTSSRQKQQQQYHQETHDRVVSTRRRVRELDDITKQDDVVLEY